MLILQLSNSANSISTSDSVLIRPLSRAAVHFPAGLGQFRLAAAPWFSSGSSGDLKKDYFSYIQNLRWMNKVFIATAKCRWSTLCTNSAIFVLPTGVMWSDEVWSITVFRYILCWFWLRIPEFWSFFLLMFNSRALIMGLSCLVFEIIMTLWAVTDREMDVQRQQTLVHKISLLYRSGPPNNGCCTLCLWLKPRSHRAL